MSKKVKKHLHDEEEVLLTELPSWFKYKHDLMLFFFVWPLIHAALKKFTTHLVVTNKRVIIRSGIVGDHSKAVTFHNLTTVKAHITPLGQFFNFGHLHLHTQTGGHADMEFHYIKNPIKIKKEIEKRIK